MRTSRLMLRVIASAIVVTGLAASAEAQFASRGAFGGGGPSLRFAPQRFDPGPTIQLRNIPGLVRPRLVDRVRPVRPNRPVGQVTPRRPGQTKPPVVADQPDRPNRPGRPKRPRPPVVVVIPPVIVPEPVPPTGRRPPPVAGIPIAPPPPRFVPPSLPPPVAAPPPSGPTAVPVVLPEFVPDEVLVTVATAALPQVEADLAQAFGIIVVERTPLPLIDARLVRLRIPDGRAVPAVVSLLAADARVISAQPNYLYARSQQVRPEPAASLAPAGLQYAFAKLGVADLHRLTLGRGTRVAVIDSGVDASHPDLEAARISHFDATGATTDDLDTHGTGVAGLIAAQGTVQGMAPGAEILSARVFKRSPWGAAATTEAILRGVTWSTEQGARVLNLSFAGPRDPLLERHVAAVATRGIILIAAAGNNGVRAAPAFPAAYTEVIAVTATDVDDRIYEKANRGGYVVLSAPGVDVIVPAVGRAHRFESGTSFAAAHVTAVVALLLEIDAGLTPARVRDVLMTSADDLGAAGRDPEFGAGRINALAALRMVQGTMAARR